MEGCPCMSNILMDGTIIDGVFKDWLVWKYHVDEEIGLVRGK